jgi:hypothetical protein
MVYLHVKLLNDSLDKSTADIVPRQNEYGVFHTVYSENPKMKTHLEKLLFSVAYVGAPGKNQPNFFADSAMELQPNSIYFTQALPEILSWRGYDVTVMNEVHKSIEFEDFIIDSYKSSSNQAITYNTQGERIVKYVPEGYVAVHSDGRVVAGGKYLNANIDKEGASWNLMKNPHEGQTPQQRQDTKQYMDVGLQDYHPGVEEGAYADREEGQEPYRLDREYSPSGQRLDEYFQVQEVQAAQEVSSRFPAYLEPGNVVYSPQTGQAFDSRFWPPEGVDYENHEWYVFTGSSLSDAEKEFYIPITGLTPDLITGISGGIVQSERNLDVSSGFRLGYQNPEDKITSLDTQEGAEGVRINQPEASLPYSMRDMLEPEWKKAYKIAKDKLKEIEALTRERVDPSLAKLKIEELRGSEATFIPNLYDYQKAVVGALTTTEQYEAFGGPKGWHGYFLNVKMGLGKTAIVTAATAVMRNKGLVANGTQTTIVTAPNKNVYVWQAEVGKFLGEHAVVIDGSKKERVEQWEAIVKSASEGNLPTFVVVGSSKFRYNRGDSDDDSEDVWELDTDAKYMKLLSLGGSSGATKVAGNHVGIMVVDESGQYVNPESARHAALQNILDSVYQGKGIVWSLNGNISGNSATDTLSEISFINKYVRDNYLALVQEYTKINSNSTRENKSMGRRIWKDFDRIRDFFYTFGPQIYSLDGKTVAGENYGLTFAEDQISPLGREWGKVYLEAERKLASAMEENAGNRAMGLLSILINAGYGAVSAPRMLEYDIGTREITQGVEKYLQGDELKTFYEQYANFVKATTETFGGIGRLPKRGMPLVQRDEAYRTMISEKNREILNMVTDAWECPYTTMLMENIKNDFQQNTPADRPLKIGIAGFSKISINKIARKLREAYPQNNYLIQVVDGDTAADEVGRIQANHQNEDSRNVIALVTGAGAYGLSLPTDVTYRSTMWNSAKGSQSEARFHRKAEQKNFRTVTYPSGITQYMRELENMKGSMASSATNVLLEVDDDSDEITINTGSTSRLLDKLRQYRPRILGEEE